MDGDTHKLLDIFADSWTLVLTAIIWWLHRPKSEPHKTVTLVLVGLLCVMGLLILLTGLALLLGR